MKRFRNHQRDGKNRQMRLTAVLICALLAGCAGSMDRISELREAAPDWYEARKQEFQGRGYPKLNTVPSDGTYQVRQTGLVKSAAEQKAIREAFYANPRSEPSYLTPAMMMQWAAEIRQRVDARDTPADFLTDQQIALLKARFDRPRARR